MDPEGRAGGIPASCEIRLENPFAPCLFSSALSSAAFLCRYGRVRNPSIGKECVGNPYRDATKISVREVEVGRKHRKSVTGLGGHGGRPGLDDNGRSTADRHAGCGIGPYLDPILLWSDSRPVSTDSTPPIDYILHRQPHTR